MMKENTHVNLQLFADAAAPAGESAAAPAPAPAVDAAASAPGTAPASSEAEKGSPEAAPAPEDRRKDWEAARDKYRDLYEEDQEAFVTSRLKKSKGEASKANADAKKLRGMLEPLYAYYGIKSGDEDALAKAIDADNMYYERLAMESDMAPEKYRELLELKRYREEHEQIEAARERDQREERERQAMFTAWARDEAEIREKHDPNFDVIAEARNNPTFQDLIYNKHVDVSTAYAACHAYEIAEKAAQEARESAVKDIAANGSRPVENGVRSGSAAIISDKPLSQMTKKERDEFVRKFHR